MLKALLKKQLLGIFQSSVKRSAFGKKSKKSGTVIYVLLLVYLLALFGGMFLSLMHSLCNPLHEMGLDWLYFVYAAIIATVLGVFGSVFMAQSQLYQAKDNELLLSLPIPAGYILLCRMVPLYLQTLLFESIVLIPCFIVYATHLGIQTLQLFAWILLELCIPLFGLVLSCLLGWLVAMLTARMRNKAAFTIILSLAFLGGYYYVYFRFSSYLQMILLNSAAIGASIKGYGYILYLLGTGALGNLAGLATAVAICIVLFGILYLVLSRTYLNILTAQHNTAKAKYRRKAMVLHSSDSTLLKKEWKRFTSSATYLMNSGFGVIMLLVAIFGVIFKGNTIVETLNQIPGYAGNLPLIATAAITLICSTNLVSAPSVSLEGKNLWILQSFPVEPIRVLNAKLKLHILVSAPIAAAAALVFSVLTSAGILMTVFMILAPIVSIVFFGCFGLMINLLKPMMDWDNEAQVVKQSASVMLSLFLSWGIALIPLGLYFLFGKRMEPALFLLLCTVLFACGTAVVYNWIVKKGSKIFANL